MESARAYVGNLSQNTTEGSLRDAFELEGGRVVEVKIALSSATGRSRGFGFVEMGSPSELHQAIQAWNGRELDGHALHVSDARANPARGEPPKSEFSKVKSRR